jgi:PHD/YefM family antitoxin component YafN of YafNO toxin-antitoxin module
VVAVIETERQEASAARVPVVQPGKAIVVTRYDEEKAVVVHPDDFRRLTALERDLEDIASTRPEMSDLALKALALEDVPGSPIEDPEQIKSLLGL